MEESRYEISWFRKHNEVAQTLKEKEAQIVLLSTALKAARAALEEDMVPSPFVEGARDRLAKTLEMIAFAG